MTNDLSRGHCYPWSMIRNCYLPNLALDIALNNKTIILFNLAQYRLILANSASGLLGWVLGSLWTRSAVGKVEKELNASEAAEWGLGKIIVLTVRLLQYSSNKIESVELPFNYLTGKK